MSLISDLLSKIKLPQSRRDVPPGLKSAVSGLKGKHLNKRLVIGLSILSLILLGSGFFTAYMLKSYPKPKTMSALPTGQAGDRQAVEEQETNLTAEKIPAPLNLPARLGAQAEQAGLGLVTKDKTKEKQETKEIEEYRTEDEEELFNIASLQDREYKSDQLKKEIEEEFPIDEKEISTPQEEPAKVKSAPTGTGESEEKYHHLYAARSHEQKNDYLSAISSYKKVLEIEPENYKIMNKIASIFIRMNLWEEAMKYLQDSLKAKQDYPPVMINTAIVYAKTGKFSMAEKNLLKALSLNPINRAAIFNIALLYEKHKSYDKAQAYYLKLHKLGDDRGRPGLQRTIAAIKQ